MLQPATGAGPEPGTLMAFEVNDVGRLALGGQMGPEIAHIEGRLLSSEPDEYQIAVRSVKLIRGGDQIWSGERIKIKKDYISETYERRFSKSRTVALVAVFVVGAYAIIRSQDLFGLGHEGDPAARHDTAIQLVPRRP